MIIAQPSISDLRTQTNLNAALRLQEEGWHILPTKLADKSPYIYGGVHRATDDPEQAREWWERWPEAQVSRRTGQISGRYILDLDSKAAVDEAIRRGLPETDAVRTGRVNRLDQPKPMGGGWQFVFNAPDDPLPRRVLFPGADLRAEDVYCVAPPSQHPTGRYYKEIPSLSGRLADLPAWIIELAQQPAQAEPENLAPLDLDPSGPAILDGERNRTLFRVACSLRARGAVHAQIAAHLSAANLARCCPPLGHAEVEKIAKSAARYPAGNAAPQVGPEVLAMLDGYEAAVRSEPWKGSGYTDRDTLLAFLEFARHFGTTIPAGIRFEVASRDAAPVAAVSLRTFHRSVQRLKVARWLRQDNADRGPKEAGAFVLLASRANCHHSTTFFSKKKGMSGVTMRVPAARWGRVGKKNKALLDKLLELGGAATVKELAEALGDPRPWELRRRHVLPLSEAKVLAVDGDAVMLAAGWQEALDEERDLRGEIRAERLDRDEYERQRQAFRESRQA